MYGIADIGSIYSEVYPRCSEAKFLVSKSAQLEMSYDELAQPAQRNLQQNYGSRDAYIDAVFCEPTEAEAVALLDAMIVREMGDVMAQRQTVSSCFHEGRDYRIKCFWHSDWRM